jgi:hypothetical protein
MSPFIVTVVVIQVILFAVISMFPLVSDGQDVDTLVDTRD